MDEIIQKLMSCETDKEKAEFLKELGMSDELILAHLRMFNIRERIESEQCFQSTIFCSLSDLTNIEAAKTTASFLEKNSYLMSEYASSLMQISLAIKSQIADFEE